jgi:hypothetical protein
MATSLHGSHALTVAVCLAIVASVAAADDGSVESVHGSVRLMKEHGNIRMVSETVRARVSKQVIEVDCVFTMKNEGSADTVLVGFPDGPMDGYGISSFLSWVDGVEVKCGHEPDGNDSDASWWTRRVVFPSGAVRTFRDHYKVSPSWFPIDRSRGFRYILKSGASWKGTIGAADILATLDGIPLGWITGSDPEARRVGRSFRWSFRDFEPGSTDGSPSSVTLGWRLPEPEWNVETSDTLAR